MFDATVFPPTCKLVKSPADRFETVAQFSDALSGEARSVVTEMNRAGDQEHQETKRMILVFVCDAFAEEKQ